ncbi:hypothetical protein [Succinivibrio dextrinosolvens]|jgi:hypothetical protein|uniref:hypothetical protein n=1 Tax=Succinivibrio dextrinosolvens TaxID=83771 RepID=UPI0019221122|nr:hypothetical protein [Succinivibrio dextrinosolvens]
MEITRIYLSNTNKDNLFPNFDNQLTTRYVFDDPVFKAAFEAHEYEVLDIAVIKMRDFINDPERCNNSEGMFPQPKYLTGEWYLSEVLINDERTLRISARFLGTDTGKKTDYLRLEVCFFYDEEYDQFLFEQINSESL